jgi:hypothetical protein
MQLFKANTIRTAPTMVKAQSTAIRTGRGSPERQRL